MKVPRSIRGRRTRADLAESEVNRDGRQRLVVQFVAPRDDEAPVGGREKPVDEAELSLR